MHTKKIIISTLVTMVSYLGFTQTVSSKLAAAVQQMEADAQLKHAVVSICVVDAQTGKPVYAHNAQMGMAPASSQKIFTSVAAFDMLGHTFRYRTRVGYTGKIDQGNLIGNLIVQSTGDPTFGSWRWKETKADAILTKFTADIKAAGITKIQGMIMAETSAFSAQAIPGGWIWDDIGNYYGAGSYQLNWKENQYDVTLRSGTTVGAEVAVLNDAAEFTNELKAAAKGSGDNAYIYLPVAGTRLLKGTIPVGEKAFTISGALTDPVNEFLKDLEAALEKQQITRVSGAFGEPVKDVQFFSTYQSPPLDSINFWFMRKSINLYGEALLKSLALEKGMEGSTEAGVEVLKNFWSERGIEKSALKIMDGSGLSPQNRVTTDAQVKALMYAKTRPWYNSFFHALPEYNGMKMKSGTIGGAKAFAGYHKNYVFSIIVNNFDGSAGTVVQKMYKVLDGLK